MNLDVGLHPGSGISKSKDWRWPRRNNQAIDQIVLNTCSIVKSCQEQQQKHDASSSLTSDSF